MIGLSSAQVVILDDEKDEAMLIVRALSRQGVPSAWFTGEVAELPPAGSPLPNVRLAFLDVDLTGGGLDNNQLAATLVQVVARLFPSDAAGLGIVLWTNHPEVRDLFLEKLLGAGGPIPIFVITLPKADFKTANGMFDLEHVSAKLREILAEVDPWGVLFAWENELRAACAHTVSEIVRITQRGSPFPTEIGALAKWQADIRGVVALVLHKLAREQLGDENVQSGVQLLRGAFAALLPVMEDQAERKSFDLAETLRKEGDGLLSQDPTQKLPAGTAGEINAKISLAPHSAIHPWSGMIYEVKDGLLADAFGQVYSLETVVADIANAIVEGSRRADEPTVKARSEKINQVVEATSATLLVDIHPTCDYAQNKTLCGLFVTGIRVKSGVAASKIVQRRPDGFWVLGPVNNGASGDVHLILDLRRIVTAKKEGLAAITPWRRLRSSYFVELLSQLRSLGARPGVLLVHE
jgi:hypothetical protein